MSSKQISIRLRDFVQAFGPHLGIFYYLVLVHGTLNEKKNRENSDFPTFISQWKNSSQDYFWP